MSGTPKRVRQAMLPPPVSCAGMKLLPVTASHWCCLEEIDSPLLRKDARRPVFLDYVIAALLLSVPAEEAERRVTNEADLAEEARQHCRRIPAADMRKICRQVVDHLHTGLGPEASAKRAKPEAEAPADKAEDGAAADPTRPGPASA